jgi:hypothetical protein
MGKKNSGAPPTTSNRGSKRGRGRGGSRGSGAYKGRERDITGRRAGIDGRPDSAIDVISDDEGRKEDVSSAGQYYPIYSLELNSVSPQMRTTKFGLKSLLPCG